MSFERLTSLQNACCGGSRWRGPLDKGIALPRACHPRCLEMKCSYFSHSTFYQECIFCDDCNAASDHSSHYTSWRSLPSGSSAASPVSSKRSQPPDQLGHKHTKFCRASNFYAALNRTAAWMAAAPANPATQASARSMISLLRRRSSAHGCVFLPALRKCPGSLANALQMVANTVLVSSFLGLSLEVPDSTTWRVLTNCTTQGFPRFELQPSPQTSGRAHVWLMDFLSGADVHGNESAPRDYNRPLQLTGISLADRLKRYPGRCIALSMRTHGQEVWGALERARPMLDVDTGSVASHLFELGAHAAYGTALRWAFSFGRGLPARAAAEALGAHPTVTYLDELRISVHVRHFVVSNDLAAADAALLRAIEARLKVAVAASTDFSRCAILLASDRRLTLSLFDEVASRVGCRLVVSSRDHVHTTVNTHFMEHGIDVGTVALRDLELLGHGHLLIGTWGSSFTLAIGQLMAARYDATGHAQAPLPTVTYCCGATCLEPWSLMTSSGTGATRTGWHVSLASFPAVGIVPSL